MSTDKKVVKPMDDGIREQAVGVPSTNAQRVCWAVKTLVAEVHQLFPETPVEYSNYNGRNTALDVTFDLTAMDGGDSVLFNDLMMALSADTRVLTVIAADYEQTLVSMRASARTQDNREPFGLVDAWAILTDGEGDGEGEDWGHGGLTAMVGNAPWTDPEFVAWYDGDSR